MKHTRKRSQKLVTFPPPTFTTWIQAPLPHFLRTLPILISIEGQGSGRQGPSPLAPLEEPVNE